MATFVNIILQGTVYYALRRTAVDASMLSLISSKLVGVARESTFDTLYSKFSRKWHKQDDVVYPFHYHKNIHVATVWTFDLDNDVLRFDKQHQFRQAALSIARQRPLITSDFDLYEPPMPLGLARTQPYQGTRMKRPKSTRLERRKALVFRILTDFAVQWSHVLCGPYNNSTFRRLAHAIISIVTLDFDVVEPVIPRSGYGGYLVEKDSLPDWEPLSEGIVWIGRTPIVICQHISDAITLIRANFAEQELVALETGSPIPEEGFAYLIFSGRTILLYQISGVSEGHTEAEYLFGENFIPSYEAVDLLLEATQVDVPSPYIPLPLELQDMILDYVSERTIEGAQIGCKLDIGSTFTWTCGNRKIEREEVRRHRSFSSPAQSCIWFGKYFGGVAYK